MKIRMVLKNKRLNNSYFKLDGAQQLIKLSINQLILYAKHFLHPLSVPKFVSSNRIDRLEIRIVFQENSLNLYKKLSIKSQGV